MRRLLLLLTACCLLACSPPPPPRIRLGHFPNVTHVQALVAHAMSRSGNGWFEARLGMPVDWYVYNAGPSAMEALLAGSIDALYVGPSPAINTYVRSRGEEARILAGAANGGAGLVVQPALQLRDGAGLRGKRIGTPQLGNTQDIACRAWLQAQGLRITQTGGDAQVIPTANPDQLALFLQKKLDAVWTVEPWVTRLLRDAGGVLFLEEKESVATVLVGGTRFLKNQRALAAKLVQAHEELTAWICAHPQEAQRLVVAELEAETKTRISPQIVAEAWGRITLTTEISLETLKTFLQHAQEAGFLRDAPALDALVFKP